MALQQLTDLLDRDGVRYAIIKHSPAYTAQEIAETAHVSGRDLAKTVIVDIDGMLAMAVVRATDSVDTEKLQKATAAKQVVLSTEADFAARFRDCELGAMPPFGNLYDMTVFVSTRLTRDELICFNAGTHRELIQMGYDDFERLVSPVLAEF